ncbi:HotDog domain-containing protein [Obelidium mucronatum]|nr:HotDog domain-containing protein [Obelidium mucronatum]
MFAFPGGVGLKKNSRLENPDSYEKQLIRGTTLYGKNRIEFAFQGYDPASNVLTKVVRFGENLCGHPGIVHGGLISAFFDDAFGSLFWINSNGAFTGVTANLTVNYRSPMPAPTNVAFILWLEREEGRKVFLKAEARSVAGQSDKEGDTGLGVGSIGASVAGSKSILFAEATALFIKLGAVVVNKT